MSKAELRAQAGGGVAPKLFDQALAALVAGQRVLEQPQWVKLAGHTIRLGAADEKSAERITTLLAAAPFSPTKRNSAVSWASPPMSSGAFSARCRAWGVFSGSKAISTSCTAP